VPAVFQERRQPRPFRIIHMPVGAFVDRFILKRPAEQAPPKGKAVPDQAPDHHHEKATPWTCGIDALDEEYEALFRVIRQFQGALKSKAGSSHLEEVMAALADQVERQLTMEEAHLDRMGFPGRAEHLIQHQAFRYQIQAFHLRIASRDPQAGLELSQQLFAWLRVHVRKEDPVWSEYAKSRRRR
jgi:hemerythrin